MSENPWVYLLPMNFAAGLVNDNYCKIAVLERVFVAKPACKLSAILNGTSSVRKL